MPTDDILAAILAELRRPRPTIPLDLARMVGHRDLKMLQAYYNASAEEIAGRLG